MPARAGPDSAAASRLHRAMNRAGSGVLVHEVHELLGLDRGEVDVVCDAVPAGDADRAPAIADADNQRCANLAKLPPCRVGGTILNGDTGKRFTWEDACAERGVRGGHDAEATTRATT